MNENKNGHRLGRHFRMVWYLSEIHSKFVFVFSRKKHVFYEGLFQNLAFYMRVDPKGPQEVSFYIPFWYLFRVILAPFSNRTFDSEKDPRKTHAFYKKKGTRV